MKGLPSFAFLLLAACIASPILPPEAAFGTQSAGRQVKEESELLDFTYSYPAEAAAIPALRARFEADIAQQRADALEGAEGDREVRGQEAPFHGHYFSQAWVLYGSTGRLLSLASEIGTYTGGAHGNSGFVALLWDRAENREIELSTLFTDAAAAYAAMAPSYCAGLDRQRAEKREETLPLKGEGWMVDCPSLAEQEIAPADLDKDGRLDTLRILIAPYGAGPYAEGSYEVDVPVTRRVITLLKPDYATEFQPQ